MAIKRTMIRVSNEVAKIVENQKKEIFRYKCKVCHHIRKGKVFKHVYCSPYKDIRKASLWQIVHPIPVCSQSCYKKLLATGSSIFQPAQELLETTSIKVFTGLFTRKNIEKTISMEYFKALTTPEQINRNIVHLFMSLKYGYEYYDLTAQDDDVDWVRKARAMFPLPSKKLHEVLKERPELAAKFKPPLEVTNQQ